METCIPCFRGKPEKHEVFLDEMDMFRVPNG